MQIIIGITDGCKNYISKKKEKKEGKIMNFCTINGGVAAATTCSSP